MLLVIPILQNWREALELLHKIALVQHYFGNIIHTEKPSKGGERRRNIWEEIRWFKTNLAEQSLECWDKDASQTREDGFPVTNSLLSDSVNPSALTDVHERLPDLNFTHFVDNITWFFYSDPSVFVWGFVVKCPLIIQTNSKQFSIELFSRWITYL